MKTSLLNRLQSPLPAAENTPQTASVANPEVSSGFAGLFQKAIGWLSPKTAILEGGSNGTIPKNTDLQLNENQPLSPSDIAVNHIPENPIPIARGNNDVSEDQFGIVDFTNGVNSIPAKNEGNVELLITESNLQNAELVSIDSEVQVDSSSALMNSLNQLVPTDTQESSHASTLLIQKLNGELLYADSQNETTQNHTSAEQSTANVISHLSLEDVVASVYAAVQTNLPSEKVDISYQPSGKNSTEITLSIKNAVSQNGTVAGEQITDSLQFLETLSQHIDTIQKTVGKSATVKFGIGMPRLTEDQLLSGDRVGEGGLESNIETTEIPSKIQNDISRTAAKDYDQIVELAGTLKLSNDFVQDSVQVSEEDNSVGSNEKAMSGTVEQQEVTKDNTVSQDTNAMIAAALLSTINQPKIESQSLETNEDTETDTPNDNSEKTTYQTEKHTAKNRKTVDTSLGVSVQVVDSDTVPIYGNSDVPFQNGKQSRIVSADAGTENTASIDTKGLHGFSTEVSSESTVESTKVNRSTAPQTKKITTEYSNGIQQAKVDGNPQANGTHETSVPLNVAQPQVNISSENVQHESFDTQENIGMSLPLKGNNNSTKTVQNENTAQHYITLKVPSSDSITDSQIPKVLSNQKATDSNAATSKTDENLQTTEIQKQSFNSVRELLDASAKNGITVSSLVIRVDTPEMEIPESNIPTAVNQQATSKNNEVKLDVSKDISVISSTNYDDIETEIPQQTAGKQTIEAKQTVTAKAFNIQTEVLKPTASIEQDIQPLTVLPNTLQAVVPEPAAVKLNTPKAGVLTPAVVKSDTPQIEPEVQNSVGTDIPNVGKFQPVTNGTVSEKTEEMAVNNGTPVQNPKTEAPQQVKTKLDSTEIEAPKLDNQIAEQIAMKSGMSQSEQPKKNSVKSDISNAEVPQQTVLKSSVQQGVQTKPISATSAATKTDIVSKIEGNSTSVSTGVSKPHTTISSTSNAKEIQSDSQKQESSQIEHTEVNVSESAIVSDESLLPVGVKVTSSKKEGVKSNIVENKVPAVGDINPFVAKSDSPKAEEAEVETTTSINTPKLEVSNSKQALSHNNESVQVNNVSSTVPKANKTSESILSNEAAGEGQKPEMAVKKGVSQSSSLKEQVINTPTIETSKTRNNETTEANAPQSAMPQTEVKPPVSKNETTDSAEKVETPKAEKVMSDTVKSEVIEREKPPVKAQQLPSEQTSTTVQSRDISAIAGAQKTSIAAKTETKTEKRTGKTESAEATANTILGEQLPKQVTERNPMNQNEQQKQDNKQQLPLDKKNFETTIAQEVQQGETVPLQKESISNADSIRAKASVESNNPNPVTNAALFQPVAAPNKNYQNIDSVKKTIPRVDVDSFAPATAQLVRTMPQQTGGSVRMQLTPDALGAVTVQVNVRDKNAALRIDVETTAAKQALEAQIPLLREQMAQQGITTERIEIQVRPREDFSMFSGFNQQNSSARQEEQQARQSYLRSFGDGREDMQDSPVQQEILPKVKDKKSIIQNRVEFYA